MDKKEKRALLKKARSWAYNNLIGKKVYLKEIKKEVIFRKKGIKHALYAKTDRIKIELIYHATTLLKTSNLHNIENDKKRRPEIKNVYKFVNTFKYKNKDYPIYIVVRETPQGFVYYDHGKTKKKP